MANGSKTIKIPSRRPAREKQEADAEPSSADADAETLELQAGEKSDKIAEKATERDESFKDAFHFVVIWGLRFLALGLLLFASTWTWHVLTPDNWHWLTADQVDEIQKLMTGSVLGGVFADQIKRRK